MEMRYFLTEGYTESYNAIMVSVPVMLRYNIQLGKGHARYFFAGGFKLGLPITATASITPGRYNTEAYYQHENCTYTDVRELGTGQWNVSSPQSSNIKLNITPIFAFETGCRFPVDFKRFLSVGLYLDYSLQNAQQTNSMHPVEYQAINPSSLIHNSLLNSAAVKKISLIGIGLKVGINLNREL
jgi:hypothetical protein